MTTTPNFYEAVIKKDPRYASTDRISDIALLEPGTRTAVEAFIADAKKEGHDLRVLETYRSQARQHALYDQRLTELEAVGVHGYGLACDMGLFVDGKYDPTGQHYEFFVPLARKHGLVSGIDWGSPNVEHSFKDWDHVQRIPVSRQNELFAGTWYPSATYNPYTDGAKALPLNKD